MDTSGGGTDQEKRNKREIANSNERRRMQSINAGFQNLRRLLPHNDGEKLSKASILQAATDLIQHTEQEKAVLYEQNSQLKKVLISLKNGTPVSIAFESIDLDALTATISIPHTNINKNNTKVKDEQQDSNLSESVELEVTQTATKLFTPNVKRIKIETLSNSKASSVASYTNNTALTELEGIDINPLPASIITTTTIYDDPTGASTLSDRVTLTPATTNAKTVATNNSNTNQASFKQTTLGVTNLHSKSGNAANPGIANDSSRLEPPPSIESNELEGSRNGSVLLNDPAQNHKESGAAKAAIALPLEVPYSFETVVTSSIAEKRQNLDTICQAIQQIEGECVFKDDEK